MYKQEFTKKVLNMTGYINPNDKQLEKLCKKYIVEQEILSEKIKRYGSANNSTNNLQNIKHEMLTLLLTQIKIDETGNLEFNKENNKKKISFDMRF